MNPNRLRITGHLAADIRTYRITGGQWTEVRMLDNCAYGCKLHARRVDGFVEYALIHSATYGCPLGRDMATAVVPVTVEGVVSNVVAPVAYCGEPCEPLCGPDLGLPWCAYHQGDEQAAHRNPFVDAA